MSMQWTASRAAVRLVCSARFACVTPRLLSLLTASSCSLDPGYTGASCQTDIDECAPGPCLNGGTCFDGNSLCSFSGTSQCFLNLVTACITGIASYFCNCTIFWTGLDCSQDVDGMELTAFSRLDSRLSHPFCVWFLQSVL